MTRFYCEKCTYKFIPLMDKDCIAKGVWCVYTPCPRCGHRHTAYYINKKIKEMQADQVSPGLIENEMKKLKKRFE